eukprot:c20506_g1_i1 orf=101-715(+)
MQQPSCCLLLLHARLGDMPLAALRGTSACVGCKSTQCKGHQRITFPDKLGDGGVLTGRSSFLCMGLGSVSTVWNSGYHPCFIASDVGRSSAQRGATPLQEAEILAATVMERRAASRIELEFSAEFFFSVGSLYQPPPLLVDTLLTTEKAQGQLRSGHGHRLDSAGFCELVGVAPLVQIDDAFMNSFLMLPTDCLAAMSAKLTFF